MWRIVATLCVAAVAQFTPEKLDEMATSIQGTADKLNDQVISLSQSINPLTAKIPTFPGKMMGADDATKAEIEKQMKSTIAEMCKYVDSLGSVVADVEKASADAKDDVNKINAQIVTMAADPEKLTDGPKFQYYLGKIQKAITMLDTADITAKPLTALSESCKSGPAAATRLFLDMKPVPGPQFHLPSALLGAVAATVIGSALILFRSKSSGRSAVALMEEGDLE
mmetsp:Transcript_48878/g.60084  ORF Transcript_48878/g.60084 Transcript_48878/m.60084 type:complete len:225 (+) Transcript_48878:70-744(+)